MYKIIDDLFLKASENDSEEIRQELLNSISELSGSIRSEEISDNINFLLESWDGDIQNSPGKAEFCFKLASFGPEDSSLFRNALSSALKPILPDGFTKVSAAASIALRDKETSLSEIAERFYTMRRISSGQVCYYKKTKKWVQVEDIDSFAGEILLKDFFISKKTPVPLPIALLNLIPFKGEPELLKFLNNGKITIPAAEWINIAKKSALTEISREMANEISFSFAVPDRMNLKSYQKWWSGLDSKTEKSTDSDRHFTTARSIHELRVLLKKTPDFTPGDEDVKSVLKLFSSLRKDILMKDRMMLAESVAIIAEVSSDEFIASALEPLATDGILWSEEPESISEEIYELWLTLPAKHIAPLMKTVSILSPGNYSSAFAIGLPIRCWNHSSELLGIESLAERLKSRKKFSADALLWVWKNISRIPDEIKSILRLDYVLASLSESSVISSQPSRSSLYKLLMDNSKFQNHVLDISRDNPVFIIHTIQRYSSIDEMDRSTLLVKFSRHSDELKKVLKEGKGKAFSALGKSKEAAAEQAKKKKPKITSRKSYRIRMDELDNIINKELPANTAAIAHARSYGDLRENAEYSAAKERQRFLLKRRETLERELLNTQFTDFKNAELNVVSPGCVVELKMSSGQIKTVFILGLWDTDPDRNHVSFYSAFGKSLAGKSEGDDFLLPDGSRGAIVSLKAIPGELYDELADEDS